MSKSLSEAGKLIPTVECLIVHDGKVLLLKRSETSKNFPGYWIGPGGHIDDNDDVLSAAVREVFEETGVKVDQSKISLKVVAIGNHQDRNEIYMVYYFLINLDTKQEIINSDEGKSSWVPLEEVLTMDKLFPPFKYYLEHALNEKSGILYTNVILRNLEIVEVISRNTDKNG